MSLLDARSPTRFAVLLSLMAAPASMTSAAAAPQFALPVDLTDTVPSPRLLQPLDLDGDGDADVLVAESNGAALYWIESLAGSFGRVKLLLRAPGERALWAFEDLDGDGDLDAVATTVAPVKVFVFERLASGTFAGADRIAALGGEAVGLDVDDVTGDGIPDIVVATDAGSVDSKGVFALRGLGGRAYWWPTRITPWSQGASGIVTGTIELVDLDRDADLDVLMTDREGLRFVWFRNQGAGQAIGPYVVDDGFRDVSSVACGDLDGDGDLDLITVGVPSSSDASREVRTYESTGFGAFRAPVVVDEQIGAAAAHPTLADLDGDGDLDVALPAADDGLPTGDDPVWFENDGTGVQPGRRPLPTVGGWKTTGVLCGDVDGDGVFDLVYGCATNQIAWCPGTLPHGFTGPLEITRRVDGARDSAALDVDQDGAPDLVIVEGATDSVVVLHNRRGEGFAARSPLLTDLIGIERIEAGDLDGDGDADLVLASFGDGWVDLSENDAGTFLAPRRLHAFTPTSDGTLTIADMDDDGDLDLVATSRGAGQVLVFEQAGGALLPSPRVVLSGQPNVSDLAVHDLDGDGHSDLVIAGPGFGGSVGWFRGQGAGAFTARQPIATINFEPTNVVVLDGDGDGDLDLAIGGAGFVFPLLEWIPQVTPGQFGAAEYVGSAIQGWASIEAADVDLDGDLDLVGTPRVQGVEPQEIAVYTSPFGGPQRSTLRPGGVSSFLVEDLDLDGDVDVVMTSERGDSVTLLEGTSRARIGEAACAGAAHSLGHGASLEAVGSERAADNVVRLRAYDLPPNSLVLLLTSRDSALVVSPGGSSGTLCLGGGIGRFVGPGEVQSSGPAGITELALDLTALPQPLGATPAASGEAWYFQAWYRDAVGGQATSNFSGSIAITFR